MWCRNCGRPCGERSFCDEFCYEQYEEEMAQLREQMLADQYRYPEDEGPQNEWCGSRGANI